MQQQNTRKTSTDLQLAKVAPQLTFQKCATILKKIY